ncbi:uncharacterized protein PV09_09122 [Verruconis gallopava]|uniref:Uncharacterized protein n=1 Tax=Verruconis gallopava TaxID=253628 RepID=A0A0D2AJQ3_9PEZI|nr:uncharacterized protein PV09_09122 [Verruconis gallopava]KIV99168.1 hypothetical protein PV09_09122 [Verruconis gallopava]
MSSFFTTPASQRKRKRPDSAANTSSKRRTISSTGKSALQKKASRQTLRDESISAGESDSEDEAPRLRDDDEDDEDEDDASSGGEDETADERRLRLAQRYLDNIREEIKEDPYAFDAADLDRDLIAERLKEDVAESKGKLHKHIAQEYDFSNVVPSFFTADQNGVTGVVVVLPYAYTVSKDGSIAKWELALPHGSSTAEKKEEEHGNRPTNITPRKRPKLVKRFRQPRKQKSTYQGHTGPILCITASTSGKFLATGGADKKLVVWDPVTLKPLKSFAQHRDKVLSLSFRRGTHTLYSASEDRTNKVWSLDEMGYVQTLFGHQEGVVDIAGCAGETFVSVGGRDRTARLFKVVEEQQLVFRGGGSGSVKEKKKEVNGEGVHEVTRFEEGSIDRVAVVDEETFVTGSDNGSISLWSVLRKKPVFTIPLAHGADEPLTLEDAYAELEEGELKGKERPGRRKPRWITALATIPLADIVLTGSWDGFIRVWRVTPDRKRLESVGVVGQDGQLSSLAEMKEATNGDAEGHAGKPLIKGIVNDISIVERGQKSKLDVMSTSATTGLCVVAAVSKSHRLGTWHGRKAVDGAKNGAVVFEVPKKTLANGMEPQEDGDEDRTDDAH